MQVAGTNKQNPHQFRIDLLWLEHEDFCRLIAKWWQEHPLQEEDIAKSWIQKLGFVRRKIKGWAKKIYRQKKKRKIIY